MANTNDTIAAIATASGIGGIGIVRISGAKSFEIAQKICNKPIQPKEIIFQSFYDAQGQLIDQGLSLYFKNPHSFTGEDIVELHAHGGPVVMQLLLKAIIDCGARLAEPGEFTKRAYLNNKIDLAQAEAVIDLINASTARAANSAAQSLTGKFSFKINNLLDDLIKIRSYIEASLDFPEEDIDFIEAGKIKEKLESLLNETNNILANAQQGRLLKDGINLVLIGQPNVGKSSLLNQFAGEDKAIVTDIPGTTRDPISSHLSINGIPINLIDTAGLRDTEDVVEKSGIQKTDNISILWVFNKIDLIDLLPKIDKTDDQTHVYISAKHEQGLDLLKNEILIRIGVNLTDSNEELFTARKRHLIALNHVKEAVQKSLEHISSAELCAEELNEAQKALSNITGSFSSDDLLGEIFSQFCIGK
jgi:tRNA modification GTPase